MSYNLTIPSKYWSFLGEGERISSDWMDNWGSGLQTLGREKWQPIPPRGRRQKYNTGEILGSFMHIKGDTRGVEPKWSCFVRDESYQKEVFDIILNILANATDNRDNPIVKYLTNKYFQNVKGFGPNQSAAMIDDMRKNLTLLHGKIKSGAEGIEFPPRELREIRELFGAIEKDKDCGKAICSKLLALPPGKRLRQFMVKQDFKEPLGYSLGTLIAGGLVSPGSDRAKDWKHKWGRWFTGTIHSQNKGAFLESMSTALAAESGMQTQKQGVISGSYSVTKKQKLMTLTEYAEGFEDFSDTILGGTLKDGNYIVKTEEVEVDGVKIKRPKREKDGFFYAEETKDIGENLVVALRQDDYDFFGSAGGNKGINKNGEFFGIDFGHAYMRKNKVIKTLKDDFTFDQPGKNPLKNISALYDNPLSEKMKGILILAKLRGEKIPEEVIESYEEKYPGFKEKLNNIKKDQDYRVFDVYLREATELENRDISGSYTGLCKEIVKRRGRAVDADYSILKTFKDRMFLTAGQVDFVEAMEKLCSETTEFSPHVTKEMDKNFNTKRERYEKKFAKLKIELKKLRGELDILESSDASEKDIVKKEKEIKKKTEKLKKREKKLHDLYAENAVVRTNCLRIDPRSSRVECQLKKVGNIYTVTLTLPKNDHNKLMEIRERIRLIDKDLANELETHESNQWVFNCTPDKLKKYIAAFSEKSVKNVKTPFKEYDVEPNKKLTGGKQKKAKDTGFYRLKKDGSRYNIKKSEKYPADNIAEVVTGSLLQSAIGVDRAVGYEFVKDEKDGSRYIASECRDNFKKLKDLAFKLPYFGANPYLKINKKLLHRQFKKPWQKRDMASVLAGCLWVGEYDCQPDNICFYREKVSGDTRVAKYDNGWGLAEICAEGNDKVDLFADKPFWGKLATHDKGGIPTNHFIDYPYILKSRDFVDELDNLVKKADSDKGGFVKQALQKIEDAYKEELPNHRREGLQQDAFRLFAAHIKLPIPPAHQVSALHLKNYIGDELQRRMEERTNSMALLSALLRIRMNVKNNNYNKKPPDQDAAKPEDDLRRLFLTTQRFNQQRTIASIMPNLDDPQPSEFLKQFFDIASKKHPVLKDTEGFQVCELLIHPNRILGMRPSTREILKNPLDLVGFNQSRKRASLSVVRNTPDLTPPPHVPPRPTNGGRSSSNAK